MRTPNPDVESEKPLSSEDRVRKQLAKVLSLARKSPGGRLKVEELADRAEVSPRHLARIFLKEVKMRPSRFLEALRVEAAMHSLEETDDPVAKIANDCGFGSRASLYRSFHRLVHMSPAEFRSRKRSNKDVETQPGVVSPPDEDPEGFSSEGVQDRELAV